jgi:TonB family protein
VQIVERRDAQRLTVAVAAAVLVHVGLFFGIPFLTSLDTAPLPDYGPIVITLEEPAASFEPPAPAPAPAPVPQQAPEPKQAPQPAAQPAPAPAAVAAAPKAVIDAGAAPVPKRAPGTPAFRQAGAATGTSAGAASASVVSGPPPVTFPAVGPSAAPGTGEQRSGEAVATGAKPAGSGGSLDTRKLETSLAGASGSTAPNVGGPAAQAPSGTGITWENPGAAKDRKPLSDPQVVLSDRVKEQALLPPEVTVYITVDADGVVSSATMAKASGYAEVDGACITAVRRVRFPAALGAAPIKGWWTFRIKR